MSIPSFARLRQSRHGSDITTVRGAAMANDHTGVHACHSKLGDDGPWRTRRSLRHCSKISGVSSGIRFDPRVSGRALQESHHTTTTTTTTSHERPQRRVDESTDKMELTFRRQQKTTAICSANSPKHVQGKTVAAVRTESDDEKRWMEGKADRGKKRKSQRSAGRSESFFPCLALVHGRWMGLFAVLCHLWPRYSTRVARKGICWHALGLGLHYSW